jgi:hypothetical protein
MPAGKFNFSVCFELEPSIVLSLHNTGPQEHKIRPWKRTESGYWEEREPSLNDPAL